MYGKGARGGVPVTDMHMRILGPCHSVLTVFLLMLRLVSVDADACF